MPKKTKKFILIDGNAIIHRSYHALPPFTTKNGELVNAVYGFASTLLAVIDKFKPEYIAVTFDLKAPTFRHKQFKDYKATRAKAPDELYAQIARVKELTQAFGIPIYEKKGFEADDVIGTIAKKLVDDGADENLEVIIVTGDLDALQLIDDNIKVWTVSRGINKAVLYDKKAVRKRYELSPEQLKDYKGLCGDASDNIPGVKGIGNKGAINLLKQYQTLENVYENIDEIKGALKEKLAMNRKEAIMSKELGTIQTDIPIEFDLQKCQTDDYNKEKLVKLFQELGFHSLIKRLDGNEKLNGNNNIKQSEQKKLSCEIIDEKRWKNFLREIRRQKEITFLIDDDENDFLGQKKVTMAFIWQDAKSYFIAMSSEQLQEFKIVLESDKIKKVGWKLKNIYKHFKNENVELKLISFSKKNGQRKILCQDVMLIDYLLNSGEKIDLNKSVLEELNEEISGNKKGQLSLLDMRTVKEVSEKLCTKVNYIYRLRKNLEKRLLEINKEQESSGKKGLRTILEKIELPLVVVLAEMELKGIRVNKIIFQGIAKKISWQVKDLENKIQDFAGEKFNVNSTQQLSKILFDKLKISTQGIKKNKTGFSTAASELKKLKGQHKIIEKIEKYRELFKLKTTYLDTFPDLIQKDGRIHTTFNQAVTATGRLSSENPNLQNIPIRTDLGKIIRTAFEADDGKVLVSADYSQIDLRVMAHMSKDKKLTEAFWAGEDIHTKTAAEINKVTRSKITKKMRYQAKALNFGVIYGMGSFGFAQSAGIAQDKAGEFISQYMKEFFGVAEFIRQTKEFAKKNGYVETEMGRRRYLPEINSPNFQVQAGAERMAVNMPIQGLAADIMKLAMIAVYEFYKNNERVNMILQIHDEIILEVDEELSDEVGKQVKKIMEGVYRLTVPLIADIKTGRNWGEL